MNMQGLEFPDMLRYAAEHSLWLREELFCYVCVQAAL